MNCDAVQKTVAQANRIVHLWPDSVRISNSRPLNSILKSTSPDNAVIGKVKAKS